MAANTSHEKGCQEHIGSHEEGPQEPCDIGWIAAGETKCAQQRRVEGRVVGHRPIHQPAKGDGQSLPGCQVARRADVGNRIGRCADPPGGGVPYQARAGKRQESGRTAG
jgi:hypothetical protein